jgi:uncharacterized membrane protein
MILYYPKKRKVQYMSKNQFILELRQGLSKKFSTNEVENALNYYEELIGDRLESGETEEDIVESFGSTKAIIAKLTAEIVDSRAETTDVKSIWKNIVIIAAICTSPVLIFIAFIIGVVLFSLGIAFFSVAVGLIATIGALMFSLIPIALELFSGGLVFLDALMVFGLMLVAIGVLILVVNTIYKIAVWLFAKISVIFTKLVKEKIEVKKHDK